MKKILKLAGTNGSGKSTVAHSLLRMYPHRTLLEEKGKPMLTLIELPRGCKLVLIGPYHTQCGGCDGIQPYSDNLRLLRMAVRLQPTSDVLMEGLLIAGMGSLGKCMLEVKTHSSVFATMDTPLEVCVDRVNQRRAARGKPPLESISNIEAKYRATQRSHLTLTEQGFTTQLISHKRPVRDVLSIFGVKLSREPRHA